MENNSTVTEQQNWRDLPHDILLQISSLLSMPDLLSLNNVCSSWKIAMKNRTRVAYPALVTLAQQKEISDHGIHGSIDNEFFFHCINEKTKYKLKKRSWSFDQYSSQIVGSHLDGWVILSCPAAGKTWTWRYWYQDIKVYLVHLFREIEIQLPNMMGTKGLINCIGSRITEAALSANGHNSQEHFIAAITSNNVHNTLALWRFGDCNWTCFGGESRYIDDIAVCTNTIYALHGCGSFGKYLEVWELNRNLSLPEKKLRIGLPHGCRSDDELHRLHVPSADELFVVDSNRFSQYQQFISKLDSREKRWIKVNSLNGRTLLCGFGNSLILSSMDVERLGYNANSIYLVKEEQNDIRVSIYHFDDVRKMYKLNQTKSCMGDEYHHIQMQTIGLFLQSIYSGSLIN